VRDLVVLSDRLEYVLLLSHLLVPIVVGNFVEVLMLLDFAL
jgi:hypothetical protein